MESLGLDIKLLLAQVVNFGLLFFILKKVLYKPLMKALDERNKKIESAVANSQKIEDQLRKFEEKEVQMLEKAKEKAKKEKENLIFLAESEKEEILSSAREEAKREIKKGLDAIKSAENETTKKLTERFMDELVQKLQSKLTADAKKNKYPAIKKLIK